MRGEVPDNGGPMRFGEAAIRREGNDVTIVGISRMAVTAERAAEKLAAEEEIEAEVIDPRTLRPLDLDTILESVRKTNRCVVVEEGWPHGGVGANLAALIQEQAFDYLDAPIQRVTGADVPMPYSKALEQAAMPHEEHVVKAALATFRDVYQSSEAADGRRRRSMPRLSDSMEEGTILRWLKSVGDEVKRGDELVEIETDKANMTYEATDEGMLIEIVAEEGDTLPIGEVIARIGDAGEAKEPSGGQAGGRVRRRDGRSETPSRSPSREPPAAAAQAAPSAGAGGRRRRAREGLAGRAAHGARAERRARAGPGLRARRADREGGRRGGRRRAPRRAARGCAGRGAAARRRARARRPRRAKGEVQVVELNRLQQTVARRMAESKATVPHFYLADGDRHDRGGRSCARG